MVVPLMCSVFRGSISAVSELKNNVGLSADHEISAMFGPRSCAQSNIILDHAAFVFDPTKEQQFAATA